MRGNALRWLGRLMAVSACLAVLASCAKRGESTGERPRVVVLTPSEASSPAEYRGAEAFVRDCADAKSGAVAVHAALPEGPGPGQAEAVAECIEAAAKDRRVRAIIVAPAPRGCAEGFLRAKEARAKAVGAGVALGKEARGSPASDLLCIACSSVEAALAVESAADLVVDLDRLYRAYIAVWAAKKMGASSLIAVYSHEEAADPGTLRERAVMAVAASEIGLRYDARIAPDKADPAAFARAGIGSWLRTDGPGAALYCSNPVLAGPVLAGAIAGEGMVVDAAGAATISAYAEAIGLDLGRAKGDRSRELALLESSVASLGMSGRLGLWESPYAESSLRGLGEFATRVVGGKARADDPSALREALDARSPGILSPKAAWLADYDVDSDTGIKSANRILLRQDIYVVGKGFLQSALQAMPAKYLRMRG